MALTAPKALGKRVCALLALPQQVPMALSKTPVLRFSVFVGLLETRESFVCVSVGVHTGSESSSVQLHIEGAESLPSSFPPPRQ